MPQIKQLSLSQRWFSFFSLILLVSIFSSGCFNGDAAPNQAGAAEDSNDVSQTNLGGVVNAMQTNASISIVPSTQQIAVGATTVIEIRVANVADLAAADIELRFNPGILQVQDADPSREGIQIQPGNFPAPDFVARNTADNSTGIVGYALTQLPPTAPVNGEGLVFSVTFQGVTDGTANLTFENVQLATGNAQPIPTIPVGGSIVVGTGTGPLPTATSTGQPTATPLPTSTSTPIGGPTPTPIPTTPPAGGTRYVVKWGDTLFSIARRFGVTVWQLASYNRIYNPNLIYVGQVLIIPGTGQPHPVPPPGGGGYTVRRGDTLYSIARRFGYTVSQLVAYNHIRNPNLIYVGQLIQFPA